VAMVAEEEVVAVVTNPISSTLLLLEDDPMLAQSLIRYLEQNDYTINWARDGEEALSLSYDSSYDLYLLDINVPLLNGTDLLKLLRDSGDATPAIIISALIDIKSVTEGFNAGADDYLKKPFDPEELLIRIKAKTNKLVSFKTVGEFEIDLEQHSIYKDKKPYHLSGVQKRIFIALVQNYPNLVTKDELLLLLDKPSDLALRVNITKLKKSLNINIGSIRGVGYKII